MADRANESMRLMFARFCRWLAPGELESPQNAIRFLDEEGASRVPSTRTGNTFGLWKAMVAAHPDLDWTELKRRADAGFAECRKRKPKKKRHSKPAELSAPLAEWPQQFQQAWLTYLNRKSQRASRLDQPGQPKRRSATDRTAEHAFGQFVGAMQRAGRMVVVDRDSVQEFIWQKREQKRPHQPRSIGNLLSGILKVARLAGLGDDGWLLQASLDFKGETATAKKTKQLIEPGDIVHAGMRLIAQARALPIGSIGAKMSFRDGLLLVLTAHFPLRRKNLSEMRIGHNIERLEDGRYRIWFSVWEMKKWNEVEYVADPPVSRLIDEFRENHRGWFVDGQNDAGYLFPSASTENGQLGGDAILRRFKKHSLKLNAEEFGCHDVRRYVGSAMMRKNGDARAVAAMLQHEGLGAVDTYARLMKVAAASDRFKKTIQLVRNVRRGGRSGGK